MGAGLAGLRLAFVLTAFALFTGSLSKRVIPERRDTCADLIADGVISHGGSFLEAKILAEWIARESGCDPNATSPDGNDGGILQQRGPARHGMSLDELHKYPDQAIAWWLKDLDRLRKICGSTRGALGVLSGGKCDAQALLVKNRCLQAGLSETCELL